MLLIIQYFIKIWLEYSINFDAPSQDFIQLLSDITKNNYFHNDIVLCTALNMIYFMAAEIKSVCFCNILLFRCVVTSVQHADNNMYISMCSLSICIYIIFFTYISIQQMESRLHIYWRERAWKMSRVWCHTNPVNIEQPTKCETNNQEWELPYLVPPKCALQRQVHKAPTCIILWTDGENVQHFKALNRDVVF